MLFIRTSGCTRTCDWCDTNYHKDGLKRSVSKVVSIIKKSKQMHVCFTGGEPILFINEISEVIDYLNDDYTISLETNGDLLTTELMDNVVDQFNYISVSPKIMKVAENCAVLFKYFDSDEYDIKVVTDLEKIGMDMLKYATILMPFTSGKEIMDRNIRQKVWQYCVDNNIRYSPRLHYEIFGKKRGV